MIKENKSKIIEGQVYSLKDGGNWKNIMATTIASALVKMVVEL